MDERQRIGVLGEEATAAEYRKLGYDILTANYRCRFGELDIVAFDGKYICVCEVKTRKQHTLVSGLEAIDAGKQERIRMTTEDLLQKLELQDYPVRFDAAEVTPNPHDNNNMNVTLVFDAFS